MIAKKEWFRPRLFGWGLRPVTREGWLYISIAVLLFIAALNLPISKLGRVITAGVIMAAFLIDVLIVMVQMYMSLDEREKKHQMIIETTVSYVGISALIIVALYEAFVIGRINMGLFVVLGAMVVAKVITSLYLWKNA